MLPINNDQFSSLSQCIKNARDSNAFKKIQANMSEYIVDEKFLILARAFNKYLEKCPDFKSPNLSFDLDHINMLTRLRTASEELSAAIDEHDIGLFKLSEHYYPLIPMIEESENTKNYQVYGKYFYEHLFEPLRQHHPKLQYHAPDFVREYIEPGTRFSWSFFAEQDQDESISEGKPENLTSSKKQKLSPEECPLEEVDSDEEVVGHVQIM